MRTAQAGFSSGTSNEGPSDLLVRVGPTIRVDVGLRPRMGSHPPDLPMKRIHALIDTGAGADGIDETLARKLNLPEVDKVEMSGINGKHIAAVYMARVYIRELDQLLFQPFAGVKLEEGEQSHRIILGRGFLRRYRMIYDGISGAVEISDRLLFDPNPVE